MFSREPEELIFIYNVELILKPRKPGHSVFMRMLRPPSHHVASFEEVLKVLKFEQTQLAISVKPDVEKFRIVHGTCRAKLKNIEVNLRDDPAISDHIVITNQITSMFHD